MNVLGIETSCDETGVAVVRDRRILSNVITAQIDVHERFGGVVPELASRAHVMRLNPAIEQALLDADLRTADIGGIAVTVGPGLAGCLMVGIAAAKALAVALDVPLAGVNHLDGHIESAFLADPSLEPPVIALLVSGGHTMITLMREHGSFEIVGTTIDDAVGEAFDKIARFVGLGFPGGPAIDALAQDGNPKAIRFPRALPEGYDFSMSGLKTAVIRWIREQQTLGNEIDGPDLAAAFQEAIVDVLVRKTVRAAEDLSIEQIVVAGGVAANSRLRARMTEEGERRGIRVVIPPPVLCTDNGAMIAAAGARTLEAGLVTPLDVGAQPGLSLG